MGDRAMCVCDIIAETTTNNKRDNKKKHEAINTLKIIKKKTFTKNKRSKWKGLAKQKPKQLKNTCKNISFL